jgi:hypothetical protein
MSAPIFGTGTTDNPYEIGSARCGATARSQTGDSGMTSRSVVTIERHIIDQERLHPDATGALSDILRHMALSAKLIAREVNKAGLVDILGAASVTRTSTASRSRSWTSSPTT